MTKPAVYIIHDGAYRYVRARRLGQKNQVQIGSLPEDYSVTDEIARKLTEDELALLHQKVQPLQKKYEADRYGRMLDDLPEILAGIGRIVEAGPKGFGWTDASRVFNATRELHESLRRAGYPDKDLEKIYQGKLPVEKVAAEHDEVGKYRSYSGSERVAGAREDGAIESETAESFAPAETDMSDEDVDEDQDQIDLEEVIRNACVVAEDTSQQKPGSWDFLAKNRGSVDPKAVVKCYVLDLDKIVGTRVGKVIGRSECTVELFRQAFPAPETIQLDPELTDFEKSALINAGTRDGAWPGYRNQDSDEDFK